MFVGITQCTAITLLNMQQMMIPTIQHENRKDELTGDALMNGHRYKDIQKHIFLNANRIITDQNSKTINRDMEKRARAEAESSVIIMMLDGIK